MRQKILALATLLALGFVFGCNGGGGPVKLENVCDEMKSALCGYLEKCDLDWYLLVLEHTSCDELIECDDMDLDEMAKSVDAGRMVYDAALAGQCLKSISDAECVDIQGIFEGLDDECQGVFTGLVVQDGNCYREDECAEGLYCDETVSECPGQCQPYKGLGDSCYDGDCDPDVADCNEQDVCAALGGAGAICDYVDCQDGLVCDYNGEPAVCLDPAGAGGSCTSSRGCEGGLQCLNGICTGPAEAGEACDVGDEGDNFMFACVPDTYCDADIIREQRIGTCQPKKTSGSECILFLECDSGLLCIGVQVGEQTIIPGSCGKPLGAGSACNPEQEMLLVCDWDLYCDELTAVCKAIPGIGDNCVYGQDPECLGNELYCDSVLGKCQQKKMDESDCTRDEECLSGYCDIGGTGKCLGEESCTAP